MGPRAATTAPGPAHPSGLERHRRSKPSGVLSPYRPFESLALRQSPWSGPFFFVRSGSAGTAQNAGVLAHFSEPRAAPDSPIFGPFFVSATPLSLTKPNHARLV